jgi:conjugal transfer pilus assembly protein TraB
MFAKQKQEWDEMDPKWRMALIAMVVAGSIGIYVFEQRKGANDAAKVVAAPTGISSAAGSGTPGAAPGTRYDTNMLPITTNRNQGLEDLITEVGKLRSELSQFKVNTPLANGQNGRGTRSEGAGSADNFDLNTPISPPPVGSGPSLPPVDFSSKDAAASSAPAKSAATSTARVASPSAEAIPPATPKVWQPVRVEEKEVDSTPKVVIPVNAGLEAVLLSGVAARPSGSTGGAIGSSVSANSVGAPFVTRIKGDAILPNGWKLSDLGDCFLGGSAVAVLSAERAYAISDTLSCVAPNGEVYEGPVKAYGLDVDGTLGLAGKVVSKQGAILFQALLTGIASGLGTALTPTPIAGLNTSAANGSAQGVQYPDGDTIARTAVGTGIGNATSQLSRFYLEFARETFPVIEVVAGTRITWILKETIELKRTRSAH